MQVLGLFLLSFCPSSFLALLVSDLFLRSIVFLLLISLCGRVRLKQPSRVLQLKQDSRWKACLSISSRVLLFTSLNSQSRKSTNYGPHFNSICISINRRRKRSPTAFIPNTGMLSSFIKGRATTATTLYDGPHGLIQPQARSVYSLE